MAGHKLTKEQRLVVEASPRARLLVEAGPGTGKTEVACARVAWLVNNGHAKPSQILFVSFTRAAIKESRERIVAYLGDSATGSKVQLSTLDSLAGKLLAGFGPKGINRNSYDENVSSVLDLMQTNDDLRGYLSTFKHIIVDEGQDTYPPRTDLVQEMIWLIAENGGATVFYDFAQSIYGWGDADDNNQDEKLNLPSLLKLFNPEDFSHLSLTKIHRTSSPVLKKLFTEGRTILASEGVGEEQLNQMKELVSALASPADAIGDGLEANAMAADEDTFYLFETRGEALFAANQIRESEYRIRLRGQEILIAPWVGLLLWDWLDDEMTSSEFIQRFRDRDLAEFGGGDPDEAWQVLMGIAEHETRSNVIQIPLLARRLSSSPPLELLLPTTGHSGPVFSTIYGAKGLQAAEVNLHLRDGGFLDSDDEAISRRARVIFVGASRAKSTLKVGVSKGFGQKLSSQRAFLSYFGSGQYGIEIGRIGDLTAEGLVGKETFATEEAAISIQREILNLHRRRIELISRPKADQNLIHELLTVDSTLRFGNLSKNVGYDLRQLSRKRRGYNAELRGIRSLGIHTVAVAPNEAERSLLHYPWNQSGFMLSPSLTGFPRVFGFSKKW